MAVNFSDIAGHERQKHKLSRIVENSILPGTILLTGPSGTGKRLLAMRTISAIFCRSANPPCGTCHECRRIEEDLHPDFVQLVPNDKGIIPIGSEDKKEAGTVRWLIDRLSMRSFSGTTAVLIDGVDRMRTEGQNALLKTIEEPTPGTHIFLVASNTSTILPTILSRCFEIKFGALSEASIISIMDKKKLINGHASVIAEISGGSVENALELAGGDMLEELRHVCGRISESVRDGCVLAGDISGLEKKLGTERLVDILINVYRQNLLHLICGSESGRTCGEYFGSAYLDDLRSVKRLQKALIESRKAIARNIGLLNALRGQMYTG